MAETIWWCEEKGEGTRLKAIYGETTWVDYCIPHIDWPRRPRLYDWPNPQQIEKMHEDCGLRSI